MDIIILLNAFKRLNRTADSIFISLELGFIRQVEIKPDMIGGYLAEYSISYKPVKHGKPGIGATHSSRFIPLK